MSGIPPIQSYPIPQGEMPNIAHWKADASRSVLLFHDMQRYFIRPFAEQSSPALSLITNSILLRTTCVKENIPIAYTAQPGSMTPQQRGLLRDFWGPGMTASPEDRQVIDPLAPRPEDWQFTKWRYSAFFKTDLLERMRATGRDQLIICGVYAHVGILTTALEAFSHDIQPFVVSDATADFTSADHTMALDYLARRCAMVMTTDQILSDLGDHHEIQHASN